MNDWRTELLASAARVTLDELDELEALWPVHVGRSALFAAWRAELIEGEEEALDDDDDADQDDDELDEDLDDEDSAATL